MKRSLGLLLCLSLPLASFAATASDPSESSAPKRKLDLHLEPKAGLPEKTLHFTVEAYGTTATNKAQLLENVYQDFFQVTGLTPLEKAEKIRVIIFENRHEFRQKVLLSRQNAVTGEHTLATFEQPTLDRVLVINLSDMLLESYFERPLENDFRWIRRGVAESLVVEVGGEDRLEARERWKSYLKTYHPVTMTQLMGKERLNADTDTTWQPEFQKRKRGNEAPTKRFQVSASSLVMFMSDWGGRLNFAFFLAQLKARKTVDDAIASAFPGKFRNADELYNFWLTQEVGELKEIRTPDPFQR